jgi:hypothetical protein
VWIEYDKEAEVLERIWWQLVRRPRIEPDDQVDANQLSKSETHPPTEPLLSTQPAAYMSIN